MKTALSILLSKRLELAVLVDSEDSFTSPVFRRNSIEKSTQADVNVIRFKYEVGSVDTMGWLPGYVNLADPSTNKHSSLWQALQLLMYPGRIPIDLSRTYSRHFDHPLG